MTDELRLNSPKFKVYKDYSGFKWSLYTPRGECIAEAPYGFKQKSKCIKSIVQVKEMMAMSNLRIVE